MYNNTIVRTLRKMNKCQFEPNNLIMNLGMYISAMLQRARSASGANGASSRPRTPLLIRNKRHFPVSISSVESTRHFLTSFKKSKEEEPKSNFLTVKNGHFGSGD